MNALVPTPALQSHLDAQVSLMTDMAGKMYDAVQRITELNLQLAQQLITDTMAASRHLMAATDPVEWSAAAVASGVPASEHLRSYQQKLMGVLAGTQVELTRTAGQHIPEATRTASAMADEVVRKGTEATEKMAAEHRTALERMTVPGAVPDGGEEQHHGAPN